MKITQKKRFSVCAPAKINMYLHITGRREDGFHLLDSCVMFADIGDHIYLKPAEAFFFSVQGPYADSFNSSEWDQDQDQGLGVDNLVVKAARRLAEMLGKDLTVDITLIKNLPLAAGMGGGSSDAAATIRALLEFWNISPQEIAGFDDLLLSLGSDVPACMAGRPSKMRGVGEIIAPLGAVDEIPVVLVNPGHSCSTIDVFFRYDGAFSDAATPPEPAQDFMNFLKEQRNDLTPAAISLVPEISKVLELLKKQDRLLFARMSGSGATCFGVFDKEADSLEAATQISREKPDWWVRAALLNRA